ncbi:MAG: cytochrome c biogenesis protein [Myxococcota bacterium]
MAKKTPPKPWMTLVIGALVLGSLFLIFWRTPSEQQMGVVYKIFYFHVGSAMASLVLFLGCSLTSAGYLIMRRMSGFRVLGAKSERLAFAMSEVGVVFGLIVLVTGPLWAKPAWGTYWTWEPRLTLMLLTWFLFVGYIVMRRYAGTDEAGRRLSAGIALMGAPATYLIHVAVKMWGGNHPTVVTEGGGGLQSPEMQTAFAVTLVTVGLLATYLVQGRYAQHALNDAVDDLFLDLSDLEDARCAGSRSS